MTKNIIRSITVWDEYAGGERRPHLIEAKDLADARDQVCKLIRKVGCQRQLPLTHQAIIHRGWPPKPGDYVIHVGALESIEDVFLGKAASVAVGAHDRITRDCTPHNPTYTLESGTMVHLTNEGRLFDEKNPARVCHFCGHAFFSETLIQIDGADEDGLNEWACSTCYGELVPRANALLWRVRKILESDMAHTDPVALVAKLQKLVAQK